MSAAGFLPGSPLLLQQIRKIMASTFFNRFIWLIDTIQRAGYITLEDLSNKWQLCSLNPDGSHLPERTFFNHRKEILSQLGINIEYVKPKGYHIANEDELGSDGLRNWMLSSIAVNSTVRESASLRGRILFEDIPSSQQFLGIILEAMKDSRQIEIIFQRFDEESPKTFPVSPYAVKLFHQRWYVLGKREKYPTPRLYSLDRIKDVRILGSKFKLPKNFDAEAFFRGYFGVVIDDTPVTTIRLKVWDPHRQYMRALKLQESQKEVEEFEEYSIFEFRMAPTWDLAMELMKYYDMIEVLEPDTLREDIIDKAYCILDLYGEHTPGGNFTE